MVFETNSKGGMNQYVGGPKSWYHYTEGPKTKRIKYLAISQTTLGKKVDNHPKRLYMEFQINMVFGFKERQCVTKMNGYD